MDNFINTLAISAIVYMVVAPVACIWLDRHNPLVNHQPKGILMLAGYISAVWIIVS